MESEREFEKGFEVGAGVINNPISEWLNEELENEFLDYDGNLIHKIRITIETI